MRWPFGRRRDRSTAAAVTSPSADAVVDPTPAPRRDTGAWRQAPTLLTTIDLVPTILVGMLRMPDVAGTRSMLRPLPVLLHRAPTGRVAGLLTPRAAGLVASPVAASAAGAPAAVASPAGASAAVASPVVATTGTAPAGGAATAPEPTADVLPEPIRRVVPTTPPPTTGPSLVTASDTFVGAAVEPATPFRGVTEIERLAAQYEEMGLDQALGMLGLGFGGTSSIAAPPVAAPSRVPAEPAPTVRARRRTLGQSRRLGVGRTGTPEVDTAEIEAPAADTSEVAASGVAASEVAIPRADPPTTAPAADAEPSRDAAPPDPPPTPVSAPQSTPRIPAAPTILAPTIPAGPTIAVGPGPATPPAADGGRSDHVDMVHPEPTPAGTRQDRPTRIGIVETTTAPALSADEHTRPSGQRSADISTPPRATALEPLRVPGLPNRRRGTAAASGPSVTPSGTAPVVPAPVIRAPSGTTPVFPARDEHRDDGEPGVPPTSQAEPVTEWQYPELIDREAASPDAPPVEHQTVEHQAIEHQAVEQTWTAPVVDAPSDPTAGSPLVYRATLTTAPSESGVTAAGRTAPDPAGPQTAPSDLVAVFHERWGVDVGQVPIVRGPMVSTAAAALGARAFTHAGIVHLPDSAGPVAARGTRALLAHELVHAVQQREFGVALPRPTEPAGHGLERAAGRVEQWFLTEDGTPPPLVHPVRIGSVQRAEATTTPSPAVASPAGGMSWTPETGMVPGVPEHLEPATFPDPIPEADALPYATVTAPDPERIVEGSTPLARLFRDVAAVRDDLAELRDEHQRDRDDDRQVHLDDGAIERLAGRLYRHVRSRLRAELLIDRERSGVLADAW